MANLEEHAVKSWTLSMACASVSRIFALTGVFGSFGPTLFNYGLVHFQKGYRHGHFVAHRHAALTGVRIPNMWWMLGFDLDPVSRHAEWEF